MLNKVKDSADGKLGEDTEDMARLLFHMGMMNSGFDIQDPTDFASSLSSLIHTGLGLSRNEPVVEIEIEIEAEKEEGDNEYTDEEEIDLSQGETENEPEMQEIPLEMSGQHDDL